MTGVQTCALPICGSAPTTARTTAPWSATLGRALLIWIQEQQRRGKERSSGGGGWEERRRRARVWGAPRGLVGGSEQVTEGPPRWRTVPRLCFRRRCGNEDEGWGPPVRERREGGGPCCCAARCAPRAWVVGDWAGPSAGLVASPRAFFPFFLFFFFSKFL